MDSTAKTLPKLAKIKDKITNKLKIYFINMFKNFP